MLVGRSPQKTNDGNTYDLESAPHHWAAIARMTPLRDESGFAAVQWEQLSALDPFDQQVFHTAGVLVDNCDKKIREMQDTARGFLFIYSSQPDGAIPIIVDAERQFSGLMADVEKTRKRLEPLDRAATDVLRHRAPHDPFETR
jgi:hypothetical protein